MLWTNRKVRVFREGHKILRNTHLTLDWQYLHRTKVRWRFCKILWPFQNIWTLTWMYFKNLEIPSEICIACLQKFKFDFWMVLTTLCQSEKMKDYERISLGWAFMINCQSLCQESGFLTVKFITPHWIFWKSLARPHIVKALSTSQGCRKVCAYNPNYATQTHSIFEKI